MFIKIIISKFIYKLNMEVILFRVAIFGRGKLIGHIQWGRVARM